MGAPSYSAFSSLWRFSPPLKTVRRTLSQRRSPPRGSPGRRRRERRKAGRTSQRNQEKEGKERRKAGRTRRTSQQRNRKQEGQEEQEEQEEQVSNEIKKRKERKEEDQQEQIWQNSYWSLSGRRYHCHEKNGRSRRQFQGAEYQDYQAYLHRWQQGRKEGRVRPHRPQAGRPRRRQQVRPGLLRLHHLRRRQAADQPDLHPVRLRDGGRGLL